MGALLLSPHNLGDDAVLFASFLCLRYRPHVVTVLRSVNQEANGITAAEREAEDAAAMVILGCEWTQWPYDDFAPHWGMIGSALAGLTMHGDSLETVFAPWPEHHGGHPQHDRVGELARDIFGDRVRFYATYKVGGRRTELAPHAPEPWMIPLKLRALACYESQMLRGPRRFFMHGLDEWTMP